MGTLELNCDACDDVYGVVFVEQKSSHCGDDLRMWSLDENCVALVL